MNWVHAINPFYIVSGFCVGALVGMTGVGGGSLMTPVLILLFGIHPASAVGTDLLYAAATKTGGTFVHGFIGAIDWRVVGFLASGSLPMAVLTVLVLSRFDLSGGRVQHVITFMLGLTLLATAAALIFRARLIAFAGLRPDRLTGRNATSLTILTGAVLGILVSLTSVGAGALGVTALIILCPSLPIARIVGSDIAHAVPLTLVGGISHWLAGAVNAAILAPLLIGSLPGIFLGSYAAALVPEKVVRYILAAVLLLVGGKLVF